MRLTFCALCGRTPKTLEYHHIIPKALGGESDDQYMLTLCGSCHGLFHNYFRPIDLGDLVRQGQINSHARPISDRKKEALHRLKDIEDLVRVLEEEEKMHLESQRIREKALQELLEEHKSLQEIQHKPEEIEIIAEIEQRIEIPSETSFGILDDKIFIKSEKEEEMPKSRPLAPGPIIKRIPEPFPESISEPIFEPISEPIPKSIVIIEIKNDDGYWGPLLNDSQYHCATLGTVREK